MAAICSGTVSVPESRPGWRAPLDRVLTKELAGLDDQALLGLVRLSPQASERRTAACELLVTRHQGARCRSWSWKPVRRPGGWPRSWSARRPKRFGISQMCVSRLRTRALGYLRSRLLDLEGTSAAKGPCVVATGAHRLCGGRVPRTLRLR
jgi:hypothetical protein